VTRVNCGLEVATVWLEMGIAERGRAAAAEHAVLQGAGQERHREFSKKLLENFDIFVLDAFGTAHKAHASTTGIANG
jgi:phosphoglycerate kinase